MNRFEENHELQLRRAKWLDTILIDYRNAILRPSTGVSIPNNDVTEVQTTPNLSHNDRHLEQPTDLDESISDVQSVEVELQPEDPPRRGGPPDTGIELEPPHIVPTPRNNPVGREGGGDLSRQRSLKPRLFITLPARTGPSRDNRFQPYRARGQPSGRTPATPADAEPSTTEEPEGQIPDGAVTHRHPPTAQQQTKVIDPRLRRWANKKGLPQGFNHALDAGIKAISKIRKVVNEQPCLLITGPIAVESKSQWKKRNNTNRRLLQELSRHYLLEGGKTHWTRQELLDKLMADLEANPDL